MGHERATYLEALGALRVLDRLQPFDPHVVGTLPLGIDLAHSDIDIVCHAPDPAAFAETVWHRFADGGDFAMHQWIGGGRPVVARFRALGWPFEIFGAATIVADQAGWRHFDVERRLLSLGDPAFRAEVMAWRRRGRKTEPAFCAALGLAGDAYRTLYDLQPMPDETLIALLAARDNPSSSHARAEGA